MIGRQHLLNFLPKNSRGVEIGVWRGYFSNLLLKNLQPIELVLVDPWLWKQGNLAKDIYIADTKVAKNQDDMDALYENVKKKFETESCVTIMRLKSVLAAEHFRDNYFDWIYIDGAHNYENVIADLDAWKNKVKVGGFITGDDYEWGKKYQFPVKKAVQEFIKKEAFELKQVKNGQFILERKE